MTANSKTIIAFVISIVCFAFPLTANAQVKETSQQTIGSYIESYTKELMKDMSQLKIQDGKEFNESFNATKQLAQNSSVTGIRYNSVINNDKVEITSTINNKDNKVQSHNVQIETANDNFIVGIGNRFNLNEHQFILTTNFTEMDTENYEGISASQEVMLVDTNDKKVYAFTITLYRTSDNSNDPVLVKNTTKIFNYTSELLMNDYASLYFASKTGVYAEKFISVNKKEYTDSYSKFLDGFNLLPIYFDIGSNEPYIYTYEVLAQIANPTWELHSKTPFYRHTTKDNFSEEHLITAQQMEDMESPFKKKVF